MHTITDLTGRRGLDHGTAMQLQSVELDRAVALLGSFDDADWRAPTDCPGWDVRRMYAHVLGACEAGASMRENVHQLRAAKRHRKQSGGPLEAALSHVQVTERDDLPPAEIVSRLGDVAPRTVRSRSRLPGPMRRMPMKIDGPVVETWRLGYLNDTIYLRDLWMHRVDACRATGRDLELTDDHDGVIIADVAAEWCRRHGRAVDLTLSGPAGGGYRAAGDGDVISIDIDAVEFCRVLAGRAPAAHPLLEVIVPF